MSVQKQKPKEPSQCHFPILCHYGVGSGPRSFSVFPSVPYFHHDLRLSRHAVWLATHFCFPFRGSGSRCSHQFDRCLLCRTVYSGFYEHHQCVVAFACVVVHTDALPPVGTVLSSPNVASNVLLLPGQYTSTTDPQLLHQILTTSSTSSSPATGFNLSTVSLPLNVALQPGLALYPRALYSGQAQFVALPNSTESGNSSTLLSGGALALSSNIWVAVTTGGSNRIILWDSIPDVSQLPGITSMSLSAIESNACSPQCSSAGVCSASGQCTCPPGFSGSSCETCAKGFFGTSCQACPTGCTTCDDGTSGTGRCLSSTAANSSSACNCLNGVCGTNGQCTCNAGWTTASNGTQCASCAPGFFLDGNGNCAVCQLGCQQCADGSGICVACKQGFTQNANDRTKCDAAQSVTNTGTVCPDGSFSNGTECQPCSPSCSTCSGPTSNDCIVCGNGQFSLGGSCVPTDGNGVCAGSSMIANNNKHECDSEHSADFIRPRPELIGYAGCPSKCTSCGIPNFNVASTINQLQCQGCLPGFVLSNSQCVESCPSGTFLSPKDNLTCTGTLSLNLLHSF